MTCGSVLAEFRLKCPTCSAQMGLELEGNRIKCDSCGRIVSKTEHYWDARSDQSYPIDFSRQWQLWEQGAFGDTTLIFGEKEDQALTTVLSGLGVKIEDLRNSRILEVGFGHGRTLRNLQKLSNRAIGIDIVRPLKSANLNPDAVICASLFENIFDDQQFDVVICLGVIHHTSDIYSAFRRVTDQVALNGKLLVYVYEPRCPRSLILRRVFPLTWMLPERTRLRLSTILAHLRVALLRERDREMRKIWVDNFKLGFYDILSPRWSTVARPDEFMGWFEKAGFEVERVAPCMYRGTRKRGGG